MLNGILHFNEVMNNATTYTDIVITQEPQNLQIAGQLIDRLVGKNMSMTYDFRHLTIDMPKAEGAAGHMGNVQNNDH